MNRQLVLTFLFALTISAAAPPPDYRFKVDVLARGMPQPMELEVAPDGRVFFNEIAGKLKIYHPATGEVTLAGEIPVFKEQENGFLGFALDPGFATNQWIYLFYSPKDFVGARLSRFVMRGHQLDSASEQKIIEFGEQRRECCHHAGSVEFGPDGSLYISSGDNTHPGGDSDGYAPIDERPDREPYDAQKSSANTHDLRGKILRIRPRPNGGYDIPEGNLFPRDGSKGRPEIFVMGCRNPWRMSVDQRTGIVYWGEVGPDAGGDGPRGSRGYDEINQAKRAGNFGWPYFVGKNFAYYDYDFARRTIGARFDPQAPTNSSPNNTGSHLLPPAQPAFIYWPYGESKEFPMLGSGGRTACAGPVFYFQESFQRTGGFPEFFDRCLLFYDWQRPFIRWARLDTDSDLIGIEPFTQAVTLANEKDRVNAAIAACEFVIQRPVDSQFGPDGCLYLLDYGQTWGANSDAQLLKISYQWGNLAPIAKVRVDKTAGREPLTIALSSEGTKDHDQDKLDYEWLLHPGGKQISKEPNPTVTLDQTGNFVVELKVRDSNGAIGSANVPVIVGNSAPEIRFRTPQEGDFFTPGEPVHFELSVQDAEDGRSEDYDELMGARTLLNVNWSKGSGEAEVEPGLAMMKQSDCFNCHAVEQKVVGPALVEIATRYRDQAGAMETSVQRVIKGSSGVWSEVPMLPHESLNPDQVRMMVHWIFGLQPGKSGSDIVRGLTGQVVAPKAADIRMALLEASYTDSGRGAAGPISAQTKVRLRARRLEAEAADEKSGLKVLGGFLGAIDHEHFARFKRLNLQDTSGITVRVASAGQGGRIELRSGSPQGELLAELEVKPTGGWDKWVELSASLRRPANRDDVFVVFVNPGKGGLMNLDWIQFDPISGSGKDNKAASAIAKPVL